MTGNLQKRIERLERASGGDFETKVQVLAARWGISAERMLTIAPEHKRWLSQAIGWDGTITWEGFCYFHNLGLLHSGPDPGGRSRAGRRG